MSTAGFAVVEHLWMFMRDAGVGVSHVALMRDRAKARQEGEYIRLDHLADVIGDAELEQRFVQSSMGSDYIPVAIAVDSD